MLHFNLRIAVFIEGGSYQSALRNALFYPVYKSHWSVYAFQMALRCPTMGILPPFPFYQSSSVCNLNIYFSNAYIKSTANAIFLEVW